MALVWFVLFMVALSVIGVLGRMLQVKTIALGMANRRVLELSLDRDMLKLKYEASGQRSVACGNCGYPYDPIFGCTNCIRVRNTPGVYIQSPSPMAKEESDRIKQRFMEQQAAQSIILPTWDPVIEKHSKKRLKRNTNDNSEETS